MATRGSSKRTKRAASDRGSRLSIAAKEIKEIDRLREKTIQIHLRLLAHISKSLGKPKAKTRQLELALSLLTVVPYLLPFGRDDRIRSALESAVESITKNVDDIVTRKHMIRAQRKAASGQAAQRRATVVDDDARIVGGYYARLDGSCRDKFALLEKWMNAGQLLRPDGTKIIVSTKTLRRRVKLSRAITDNIK